MPHVCRSTSGEPAPVAEHVAINGGVGRPLFSVSENGGLVYQAGETSGGWSLLWFGRDGKQIGNIAEVSRYFYPALSPDGTRLAVNIFGTQGTGDVWIFDLKRGTNTRLTFGPALQSSPVWTPDGKTVFYDSTAKGTPHIYAKAADGSGSERVVLETTDTTEFPWGSSSDGRYLVYGRRDLTKSQTSSDLTKNQNSYDLWVLPLFGDRKPFPIVQTPFDNLYASVSPDGKWMAYQNNETGRMEIYITAFPGGGSKWQVSTNGGVQAKWRGDGKELFFLDSADNLTTVDVSTSGNAVHLGVPHPLFQAVAIQRQAGAFDVSADGKKFLINSGNLKEGSEPMTLVQSWPAELKK